VSGVGAAIAVHLATLGPIGPTAGFFNDGTEATVGRHAWRARLLRAFRGEDRWTVRGVLDHCCSETKP